MLGKPSSSNGSLVDELVAVLAPHPKGLRRWSVMRGIRNNRAALSRDIPLKLEADVERTFRQFCTADGRSGTARFCRPAEKAGEVWALNPAYVSDDAADNERQSVSATR
jgi:hypothetical protein